MKRNEFLKGTAGLIATGGLLSAFTSINETSSSIAEPILPKALKPGDTVGITAPSGSIWNKAHIDKIVGILKEEGFKTKLGQTLYEQDGYLAGTDEMRGKEFMEMIHDPEVDGILTMRGGWGCARMLDLLDFDAIRANPKIVIGFSDITSLVNAIYTQSNVVAFHGPCGYSSWGEFTMKYVKYSLIGGAPFLMKNPSDYRDDLKTWVGGKSQGKLVGGNLTVLVAMIGTTYEPNWENSILFLEEIGEEPYRVDRMLWQMKQAGVFDRVSGVVLGSFKKCTPEEPDKSFSLEEVFEQHFGKANFPVYQGAAIGHIAPKFTLPIGAMAEMDADAFTIRMLERVVKA